MHLCPMQLISVILLLFINPVWTSIASIGNVSIDGSLKYMTFINLLFHNIKLDHLIMIESFLPLEMIAYLRFC